ncbi:MAG: hypothetical protein JWR07_744 [Nevskia sp.]|nr:hypothetical protein [Nevskia sp.]
MHFVYCALACYVVPAWALAYNDGVPLIPTNNLNSDAWEHIGVVPLRTTSIPAAENVSASNSLPSLSETKIPNHDPPHTIASCLTSHPEILSSPIMSLECAVASASYVERTSMVCGCGRNALMIASPCPLGISRQESAFFSRAVSSSALAARSIASATFSSDRLSNSDRMASLRWADQYSPAQQSATTIPRPSSAMLNQLSRWSVNDQPSIDSVTNAATSPPRKTNSDLENFSNSERSSESDLDWMGWTGLALIVISAAAHVALGWKKHKCRMERLRRKPL